MRSLFPKVLSSLAVSMCLAGITIAQSSGPVHASVAEQYLFSAANKERTSRGLPELKWDEQLVSSARGHAQQMASHGQISHQFPGEPDLSARAVRAGARFDRVAENVAESPSATQIHDLWMHSQGHRDNLLNAESNSVGIAVVEVSGQLYAVENFSRNIGQLSLEDQEHAVRKMVASLGIGTIDEGQADARQTCQMASGHAGQRSPSFVLRFTTSDLSQIPDSFQQKIRTGGYKQASIGACPVKSQTSFSTYGVAILLYR